MASNRAFLFAVLVVAVAVAELVGNAAAATYVVGDSLGWTVPPGGPSSYATWASQHVFRVGDVLVFNFSTGQHDAAHVTKGAFDGCSSTNPIALATVGPASFTLNSTGQDYYVCTFGQHCSLGQKLAINVTAASSTTPVPAPAPSSPTITPPPAPTPTPAPAHTPTHTPSPSPSSSPAQTPSPESTPSTTPSRSVTPPMPPASESAPSPSSTPSGELSPPPPPSSATIASISAPLVIFASVTFGLMI